MAISNSDVDKRRPTPSCADPSMSMMRIAIAGTGGLARLIAHYISTETTHPVVMLSRNQQPQLTAAGYQITVIDYGDLDTLRFALRGIDTVISTVTGPSQIELIKAAVQARVRRIAPAEFEGLPQLRAADDPLDRGRTVARRLLAHYSQHIQSTSFVCGIFYERFQPGGLAQSRIGINSGISAEGNYIMNCRNMTAQVPAYDQNNNPNAAICMTAAQDVARFVVKSLDLRTWPPELRMCGQRVLVKDLVLHVQRMRGSTFNIQWHSVATLRAELQNAAAQSDVPRQLRTRALLNTADGCYDFAQPNLNQHFREIRPLDFETWFNAKWNPQD